MRLVGRPCQLINAKRDVYARASTCHPRRGLHRRAAPRYLRRDRIEGSVLCPWPRRPAASPASVRLVTRSLAASSSSSSALPFFHVGSPQATGRRPTHATPVHRARTRGGARCKPRARPAVHRREQDARPPPCGRKLLPVPRMVCSALVGCSAPALRYKRGRVPRCERKD